MFTGVLIGYVALLVVGGWMGFRKAGSKVSLITAAVAGVLLALCAFGIMPSSVIVARIILAVLLTVFIMRLAKTRKFMPSGMLTALTAIALALITFL